MKKLRAKRKTDLDDIVQRAIAAFHKMTPEQQEEILEAQRQSWVRGEMGMGSDRDEAEYRDALRKATEGGGGMSDHMKSSGNVFADLEVAEPELHLEVARLRAELAVARDLVEAVYARAAVIGQCYMADQEMRAIGQWLAKHKET